jgi:hypothetical protein
MMMAVVMMKSYTEAIPDRLMILGKQVDFIPKNLGRQVLLKNLQITLLGSLEAHIMGNTFLHQLILMPRQNLQLKSLIQLDMSIELEIQVEDITSLKRMSSWE